MKHKAWHESFTYEESISILMDLSWSHVKEAGPYRRILSDKLRSRDWAGLCGMELEYAYDVDPLHYEHARQCLALFQKLEPLNIGVDKEAVALKKFLDSETQCRVTNQAFRAARSGAFCFPTYVNGILYAAQRKIARTLGPRPTLSQMRFKFGPGGTTTTRKKYANWAVKLSSRLECSTNLASALEPFAQQAPHWFFEHAHACNVERAFVDVTVGPGKLQFVPKSAKTYRSIIVEPVLNAFFQQGVGQYIRARLKRVGVDLDDQSRNQALARSGSLTGSLATVDLSSASDTISRELVNELLPMEWSFLLGTLRTGQVTYRGQLISLEKFSSMGNAFTFELESLIFWALSSAVLESMNLPTGWLAVYGDDIVLPTEAVDNLRQVFQSVGFSVNESKTHARGPFRESCGKDYFLGTDIRPYYQKVLVSGMTLFSLHNFYMRKFDFARAKKVRRYLHPAWLVFGPDGLGDGHLVGSYTSYARKRDMERGWEGTWFRTHLAKARRLKRLPNLDWCFPLYVSELLSGTEESFFDRHVVPGDEGYELKSVYTLRRGVFL